jgi:branched-chain amino acid transport system ATP-binding protein
MSSDADASGTITPTASDTDSLLTVEDLHVSYGKVQALRGVSLDVPKGELVAIIGPNGAGKTTFSDTVHGSLNYDGSVRFKGTEVRSVSSSRLVEDGLIYCSESRDLFGYMSVDDNLRLGSYRRGDVESGLELVYEMFPQLEERADQDANTLSGGEQQMVAVGRALMGDPDFLVLDEPTLGLAPVIRNDISDGLDRIQEENVTILLCEQNVSFAFDHANEIHLLENGEIVRSGHPDEMREDEYIRESYLGR